MVLSDSRHADRVDPGSLTSEVISGSRACRHAEVEYGSGVLSLKAVG